MKHDDDSGILGTYPDYSDDVIDGLYIACAIGVAVLLVGIGFVAGWMVWG